MQTLAVALHYVHYMAKTMWAPDHHTCGSATKLEAHKVGALQFPFTGIKGAQTCSPIPMPLYTKQGP